MDRAPPALPQHGGGEDHAVLARLSARIARLHKEHYGRGPDHVRSYVLDDVLIVVLRGGVTVAERTMLDAQRSAEVREFRLSFEREIAGELSSAVEELTGRSVVRVASQVLFDPDIVLEIFVLAPADEAG